jgi:iron complex outermembrane receptor protein
MEFRNEIALAGELSEIGLPLRRNVPRSHRRGVEVDFTWRPAAWLALATTANASHNRIAEWTQFYDVYDAGFTWIGSVSRRFENVIPLLTPAATLNQRVEVTPRRWLVLVASGRWVAGSWLDNTNTDGLRAPPWFSLDGSVTLSLARWIGRGNPRLRIQCDNVLNNRRIYPSGYSYQYLVRDGGEAGPFGTPYFYPQAWRSVYVMFDVRM